MKPLFLIFLALCVVALQAAPADAKSRRSHKRNPLTQKVKSRANLGLDIRKEIEKTLPNGLGIASLSVPSSMVRHYSVRDVLVLKWRSAPKVGRVIIGVQMHKSNGKIKKGWARVQLASIQSAVVANTELLAGTILRAEHLRVEQRLSTGQEVQIGAQHLVGSKVVSDIPAGASLLADQVSMPIPIPKGANVQVEIRKGAIVVATSGILTVKTIVGSTTRVRVAGKLMSGKLVREDLVQLNGSSQ